jgi:hypothetical protein
MCLWKKILIKFKNLTRVMSAQSVTDDDVKDYISFFFDENVGNDIHPHEQLELRSKNKGSLLDEIQRKRLGLETSHQVWHLLHGYLTNFYRTKIPYPIHVPVMFSPYVSMAVVRDLEDPAQSEFPEVDKAKIPDFLADDTDKVYLLQARVNGRGLTPERKIGKANDVNIGKNNVLGIPDGKATVFYDGYFIKLAPLAPGDHLIESKGYSPNFENDVRYSVYSRAGVFP